MRAHIAPSKVGQEVQFHPIEHSKRISDLLGNQVDEWNHVSSFDAKHLGWGTAMSIIVGWLIFSTIVSVAASSRGRNGVVWFLVAVITLTLIAVLFVFALPNLKHEELLSKLANEQP